METTKPIKDCAQCKHGHVLTREGKPLGHCDLESTEQFAKCIENGFCLFEPKEQPKHAGGRPPKFKTPEELQEKAEGYFQYCDTHPIEVWQRKAAAANQSAKNGSGVKSDEGTMYIRRPYTLDGLGLWCGISSWKEYRSYHAEDEFSAVIRALEARVRDQQVSGAVVGMYNANLVARLNGISESVQVETSIPVKLVDDGLDE